MNDDLRVAFWRPPYDVGYKKPPESRRFAKGKSGNPRGRPAKKRPDPKPLVDKSTMESILKMSLREVTARDGDDLTRITAFDADGRPVMIRGGDPLIAAKNRDAVVRLRDILMLQAEQDMRRYPSKEKYHHRTTIFVSHYLLVHTDSCLPKRMQLSDDQVQFRMWNISCLRKNKLEEQLKAG